MARPVIGRLPPLARVRALGPFLGVHGAVAKPPRLVVPAGGGIVIRLLIAIEADPGLLVPLVFVFAPPILASASFTLLPSPTDVVQLLQRLAEMLVHASDCLVLLNAPLDAPPSLVIQFANDLPQSFFRAQHTELHQDEVVRGDLIELTR